MERSLGFGESFATLALAAIAFLLPGSFATASKRSALDSIEYLRRVQDQFHDRIPVYQDVSSAGNRFVSYAKFPDSNAAVSMDGSWTDTVHGDATAIRAEFQDVIGANFGGFYFLNGVLSDTATSPVPNFGTVDNAGVNLDGVVSLTFWARGETGGEQIEFFLAGVGRDSVTGAPTQPFPGSSPRHPAQGTLTQLTAQWTQYSIDVSALDSSYVLGGFGWVASDAFNPGGAVFYIDDIEYGLSDAAREARLNQPRFLTSFSTLSNQPDPAVCAATPGFDLALRNMAFSYDNALAILAFLANGSPDGIRRARLIADAFVHAASHDRFLNSSSFSGAIRSGYMAGDLALPPGWTPGGVEEAVALPGYFCEQPQLFFETAQESLDVGNNAWVMIALLATYEVTNEPTYLNAATAMGNFIRTFRNGTGTFQGFQGGIDNFENDVAHPTDPPTNRPWASGEHNLDIVAGFSTAGVVTNDASWANDVAHARALVDALWDPAIGCYLAGTHDPETLNMDVGQLPLDVQSWAALAIPGVFAIHPELLACPETHHATTDAGFTGFDFNDDVDGVWFEGTAQMAAAHAMANDEQKIATYNSELERAQKTPPYGDGFGTVAATHDALSTGFGFEYFRRLHIAVAAWNVFSQRPFNPYYQDILCPGFDDSVDVDGDGVPDGCDLYPGIDNRTDTDGDWVPDDVDACASFDDLVLSNLSISEPVTYAGCATITAHDGFSIEASGEVDFHATRAVVLGNGFSVGFEATLTVVLDP